MDEYEDEYTMMRRTGLVENMLICIDNSNWRWAIQFVYICFVVVDIVSQVRLFVRRAVELLVSVYLFECIVGDNQAFFFFEILFGESGISATVFCDFLFSLYKNGVDLWWFTVMTMLPCCLYVHKHIHSRDFLFHLTLAPTASPFFPSSLQPKTVPLSSTGKGFLCAFFPSLWETALESVQQCFVSSCSLSTRTG